MTTIIIDPKAMNLRDVKVLDCSLEISEFKPSHAIPFIFKLIPSRMLLTLFSR